MLVKSLDEPDHIDHLQETFNILRSYHMKLNLEKCAFGLGSGKFLGFMVNQRGVEANPDKIKAILDMKSPSSTKELQRLNGRIATLNMFVSKSANKCLPFFKILQRAFEWGLEAKEAFQRLKAYLATPPPFTCHSKRNSVFILVYLLIGCKLSPGQKQLWSAKTHLLCE